MKILFDDQIFSIQRFGGVSRYITEIAERASQDAKVCVSAGLHRNEYLREANELAPIGCYVDVEYAWRARDAFNQAITYAVSNMCRPDVVHETYYRTSGLHPSKSKVVVTVHDMIHELYPGLAPFGKEQSAMKKCAIERADAIICVSETTRDDLLKIYPNTQKKPLAVIHHGHSFTPPSEEARTGIRQITDGAPYILFVGHRGGYKRFEELLKAFSQIAADHADLILLCFGAAPFTDKELTLQQSLHLTPDRVCHLSGSDDMLHAAYTEAEAFVYPSMYEGFGIPILEALTAGTPVICADTKIFREVGQHRVTYYEPGRVDQLAQALRERLASPGKDRPAPHNTTTASFSWEQSYRAHKHLYESLMAG